MAVQVSYPGVYIEEFAPGAPIQGVGTSTAAFIGTALSGPIKSPTLIQSWDAFESIFGGFIDGPSGGYLAPAVFGFFRNGGTACYIVRSGTGVKASANLETRQAAPAALLEVQAGTEGPGGNSISVQVADASLLAEELARIGATQATLSIAHATSGIAAMSADRRQLTVADNSGFAAEDRIFLSAGPDSETVVIESKNGTQTLTLTAPIPGSVDYSGGTARSADLATGQRRFRLTVPADLSLTSALPVGAAVSITLDGTTDVRTIESTGGDVITLTEGLASTFSMADGSKLPQLASLEFDLTIADAGSGVTESFENLSMSARHPRYWGDVVASALVTIEEADPPPAPAPADPRPAVKVYPLAGGQPDDRAQALTNIVNAPSSFLDPLKPYDDIALVAIPGVTDSAVQQAVIAHCEDMYDRFAILDSTRGATPGNGIRDQFANVRSERGFAALYYPWIKARNPLTGNDELWPPSGHLAGVYARTDQQRGVHKAPANTNIRGAIDLERRLSDDEQGPLNLLGINVLRVFPGQAQPIVWGARTTATDRNWQYVNIRRLFLFAEESIQEGIRWAVFEPNNLELWGKLKRTITDFLTRVWRDGALFGASAEEAFYVRIDEALNPESTKALGRLYIEIGLRPTYPAEFIIVRIGIWRGGSEVSEA